MKKEFLTSGQLMEVVRKLDYKGQYKACETFFQMMVEEGFGDDSEMCLRFHVLLYDDATDFYGSTP